MTTKQAEPVRHGEECQCTACRHRVLIEARAAKIAAVDMWERCAAACKRCDVTDDVFMDDDGEIITSAAAARRAIQALKP